MQKLKKRREELGLTLMELAEKIGVHFTTISDWENGKITPRSKNKIKLAEALETTIEKLFSSNNTIDYISELPEKARYIIEETIRSKVWEEKNENIRWQEMFGLFVFIKKIIYSFNLHQSPFIKETDIDYLGKNFLLYYEIFILVGVEAKYDKLKESYDKRSKLLDNKNTKDLFLKWMESSERDSNEYKLLEQKVLKIKSQRKEIDDETLKLIEEVGNIANNLFLDLFKTFLENQAVCESPLEEYFSIGLRAYTRRVLNYKNDNVEGELNVKYQYKILNYRVDFAIISEEKNIKIAIEIDGHTYHEKSEIQATNDRQRDRDLTSAGWKVLRFHRKELEEDLEKSILDLERIIHNDQMRTLELTTKQLEKLENNDDNN